METISSFDFATNVKVQPISIIQVTLEYELEIMFGTKPLGTISLFGT